MAQRGGGEASVEVKALFTRRADRRGLEELSGEKTDVFQPGGVGKYT